MTGGLRESKVFGENDTIIQKAKKTRKEIDKMKLGSVYTMLLNEMLDELLGVAEQKIREKQDEMNQAGRQIELMDTEMKKLEVENKKLKDDLKEVKLAYKSAKDNADWTAEANHRQVERIRELEGRLEAIRTTLLGKGLTEKQFQKLMADYAVKKRLEKGNVDAYTLNCYRNGAENQAIKDYRFLQELGVILIQKEKIGRLRVVLSAPETPEPERQREGGIVADHFPVRTHRSSGNVCTADRRPDEGRESLSRSSDSGSVNETISSKCRDIGDNQVRVKQKGVGGKQQENKP